MDEQVDDFLAHYGIVGMKWGKRKAETKSPRPKVKDRTESHSVKLKNGDTLVLDGERTPAMARAISRISSNMTNRINDSHSFKLKSSNGKTVGEMFLYKKKPDEMNVVWVEVDKNYRGNGYATGAMKAAVNVAKQQNLKKVTLEVPGISPDARHIYEKMGFKAGKQISSSNDVWGGLTEMQLDLR